MLEDFENAFDLSIISGAYVAVSILMYEKSLSRLERISPNFWNKIFKSFGEDLDLKTIRTAFSR